MFLLINRVAENKGFRQGTAGHCFLQRLITKSLFLNRKKDKKQWF